MDLCFYCGQEAKYQFKNGKFCCSDDWHRCPSKRKENGERKKVELKKEDINEKLRNSVKESWRHPERKIKNTIGLKKYYKNESEENRNKRIELSKISHRRKEYRDLMVRIAKDFWKREEYVESWIKGRELLLEDENFHKKLSAAIKNWHKNNPDIFKLEKNPMWFGGISFIPYTIDFNENLKNKIKERDNWECKNPDCWKMDDRLVVHHINYVKENCNETNLITLCNSCNNRANKNREYWMELYINILGVYYEQFIRS